MCVCVCVSYGHDHDNLSSTGLVSYGSYFYQANTTKSPPKRREQAIPDQELDEVQLLDMRNNRSDSTV